MRTSCIIALVVLIMLCPFTSAQWVRTSGPYGGNIFAVAVDSTGNFICSGYGGHIFRTTDCGEHWTEIGQASADVFALAVNAQGHIFAATTYPGAVVRSTNGGATWETFTNGLIRITLRALAVAPNGSLFTGGGESSEKMGLYRSDDNGVNWQKISEDTSFLGIRYVRSIAIGSAGEIVVGCMNGVFLSTDGGVSFNRISMSDDYLNSSECVVGVAPAGYYVAGTNYGRFHKTTNRGNTWTRVEMACGKIRGIRFSRSGVGYAVSWGNGAFGSGTGKGRICRTIDDGKSWNSNWSTSGSAGSLLLSLDVDRQENVLVGTDGRGVYLSSDTGSTWSARNNGLYAHAGYLAVAPGGQVFFGTFGDWVYRSTDRGASWTHLIEGLHNPFVTAIAAHQTDGVLVGTRYLPELTDFSRPDTSGVYFLPMGSNSWTNIGLKGTGTNPLFCDNQGRVFAIQGNGRSVNRADAPGLPWTTVRAGSQLYPHFSAAVGPQDQIYLAGVSFVEWSADGGVTWQTCDKVAGYPDWVYGITCNKSGHVFAGSYGRGVFRSTDEGSTWTMRNAGLQSLLISAVAMCVDGSIIAGTAWGGVYRSTSDGGMWNDMGLNGRSIMTFAVAPDGYVYASTRGGGIYRTSSPLTTLWEDLESVPQEYALDQNFPNPFNPSTTIRYGLPSHSHVTLFVFNTLGQQVAVLQNEEQEAGYHEVTFNGSNLASGVYLYRLQAGEFAQTKRLLLLR